MPYLKDPKTKEPSVSLTFTVVSFLVVLTTIGLQLAKYTDSTSGALELFYGCAALYFSRRFSSARGSVIDNEKNP